MSAYGFGIPGPFEEFKMDMDPRVLTLNSNLPTSVVAEKNLYFLLSHKGTEGSYTHKHKYSLSMTDVNRSYSLNPKGGNKPFSQHAL